ncbi:hypothetical protein AAG906_017679 [Vitis piasezkii]
MGQLKSLQKLSNYIVGKQSGTRVGELRELSHIGGSLIIQELQNVVDAKDASEANLVGKQYLDELQLEWNPVTSHSGRNYHHYCRISKFKIPTLWSPYWRRECCKGDVTSLHWLRIRGCPNLVSIELPALHFSNYYIRDCKNLKWLLHNATCFQSLTIKGCPELIFPIQGLQGLSSLTSLNISDLPNLMSLDSLELQLLTYLEKLEICDCPKLQFLTEEKLPTNLSVLTIQNCPLLKDRCEFWTGEDWHHIAHIPRIVIDDQVL